jgi:4-hydroxy-L-threonine phosphate dehydrogenase PdxA
MGDTALPIVAITMGDAAGVGPEVVIKAVQEPSVAEVCRRLVIGSVDVLARVSQMLGVELALHKVIDAADARFEEGAVDVLDPGGFNIADLTPGKLCPPAGKAAAEYVLLAGRLALDGTVDAIATAPLNKEAMREGGYHYIGHTEILAELTGTPRCTTMLASGPLRVVHVTRHIPLAQVAGHITRERVLETIRITYEGMGQLGFARPRLGVC